MLLRRLILFSLFSVIGISISFAQKDLEQITTEAELKQFILATSPSEDAFVALQRLARPYIDKKDCDGAVNIFLKYRDRFPAMSERIQKIIELLKAPSQNLEVTNIEIINTDAGEYFPVITI